MVKIALSAVLAATQLVSSNALPLYLCLSADGSICVDFGPAGCGCCEHDAPQTGCCTARHDARHDHDACGSSAVDPVDPCGCTHVQISAPQTAVLNRPATTADDQRFATTPTAMPCQRACPSPAGAVSLAPNPFESPPRTLSLLATVVLRC